MINNEQIRLYQSLFRGREDVFALRWEKGNKNGYMPAYSYDPYMYRLYKQRGGAFKDYKDKTYLKFDNFQLSKHLEGRHSAGIYPLLEDNTSWFIVSDFDKKNWKEQAFQAVKACEKNKIPAYLERSRSGNGAHVWVFFDKPYPAKKSRKIILELFERANAFSKFNKNNSFDRLFPNQDYHTGKGLGNLIALPLQGVALKQGNSCFITPETCVAYNDQWKFLESIKRVSVVRLDSVFNELFESGSSTDIDVFSKKLQISLQGHISINRNGLPPAVINFLKENLNFYNSEYAIKKKTGKNTWQTDRYFNLIEETGNRIEIPRGFTGRLIYFCKQNQIDYKFSDGRRLRDAIKLNSSIQLLPHQDLAIQEGSKKDFGIIVAPPGSGKTIIGLKLIEQKKQPALIIVHRKQIADQWKQRIETFFGIPKREIGNIGQGKLKIGKQITVALIQTLIKKIKDNPEKLSSAFGTIIVDECHHIPAKSYRDAVHKLAPYYQYGLTATPFRKTNDEKLLFVYLGEIVSEIKPHQIETFKKARLVVRDTRLDIPFNSKTDPFETLSKILVHDSERNKLILKDIEHELKQGRKAVIITERKEHIQTLYQYLKGSYETIAISGDDKNEDKDSKWKNIREGNYQAIITPGQYFGEGTDIAEVSCLFLVYPFSFKGKLIQYIGRVQRSQVTPVIYDYRDKYIPYLDRMFLKRNAYYRNLDRQATLFDDIGEDIPVSEAISNIDKSVRIPIEKLEFHYGMVSFSFSFPQLEAPIIFEIENEEIQPEFEVLKPYFAKVLCAKHVTAKVKVEVENDKIVSQMAVSDDIEKINKEMVESVKFQFVEKSFIKSKVHKVEQPEELSNKLSSLFNSAENLLDSLLKKSIYIHHRQLLYLAKKHDHEVLKIRFLLQPFSFVFLLKGPEKYHIVLETLDTKEATYVWHIPQRQPYFQEALKQILNIRF